jgi:hypothetical protein
VALQRRTGRHRLIKKMSGRGGEGAKPGEIRRAQGESLETARAADRGGPEAGRNSEDGQKARKVVFTSADKFPRWEIERTGNGLKKTREPQRLSEQWRGNPEKSKGYSKLEATRELELSPAHIHDQRRGNGVRQKPVGRKSEKNSELRSKGARRLLGLARASRVEATLRPQGGGRD